VNSKWLKDENRWSEWGTPADWFPVVVSVSPLSYEDIEWAQTLTPHQRVEWLLVMQKLLLQQFEIKN